MKIKGDTLFVFHEMFVLVAQVLSIILIFQSRVSNKDLILLGVLLVLGIEVIGRKGRKYIRKIQFHERYKHDA